MASTFHCVLATPTRKLFEGDVYYASVPGCEGSYGVLPGHELMVSLNSFNGVCTFNLDESGTNKEEFLISEGATQMYNGMLTVLGRFGKGVNEIDADEISASAEELRAHIAELEAVEDRDSQQEADLESSNDLIKWYEMQIQYAHNKA